MKSKYSMVLPHLIAALTYFILAELMGYKINGFHIISLFFYLSLLMALVTIILARFKVSDLVLGLSILVSILPSLMFMFIIFMLGAFLETTSEVLEWLLYLSIAFLPSISVFFVFLVYLNINVLKYKIDFKKMFKRNKS